jgi:hypothetical protein
MGGSSRHRQGDVGDNLKRLLKAYLMGNRRLENTYQKCVDSLSLGTLRNGLSCYRLALRPFRCLPDCAGCKYYRRDRAVAGPHQLIDRDTPEYENTRPRSDLALRSRGAIDHVSGRSVTIQLH